MPGTDPLPALRQAATVLLAEAPLPVVRATLRALLAETETAAAPSPAVRAASSPPQEPRQPRQRAKAAPKPDGGWDARPLPCVDLLPSLSHAHSQFFMRAAAGFALGSLADILRVATATPPRRCWLGQAGCWRGLLVRRTCTAPPGPIGADNYP